MSGMTICADGMENPARSDYRTAGILVSRIQLEGYSLESVRQHPRAVGSNVKRQGGHGARERVNSFPLPITHDARVRSR